MKSARTAALAATMAAAMAGTCSHPNCKKPARARGLCSAHYQAGLRAGAELPPTTKREGVHQVALRIAGDTWEKIEAEAERTGESAYAVAIRWLDERAAEKGRGRG